MKRKAAKRKEIKREGDNEGADESDGGDETNNEMDEGSFEQRRRGCLR